MNGKLYANISDGTGLVKTETGWQTPQTMHIASAKTQSCVEINSLEDFQKLIADNPKVSHVMYYIEGCPRRGTNVEKSLAWVKKLLKTKAWLAVTA